RRGVPRQRQDLGSVRLFRPVDRNRAAGLPGDALPEDDAGVERGGTESDERGEGQSIRSPSLSRRLGGQGTVSESNAVGAASRAALLQVRLGSPDLPQTA